MKEQLITSWNNMIEMLYGWLDAAIINLPNFLLAVIVFAATYWIGRRMQSWLERPLKKTISQPSVRTLISSVLTLVVSGIGLFLALGIMNLDTVLKSMLAGAGVAGLAIGLALQGTLSNTFSGVFLAVKDILNVGDFIETNGYLGTVHSINLRNTMIREPDNNIVVIPNKMVLENPFKNYGLTKKIRAVVTCGVSYDSDLEEVKKLAINTIAERFTPTEDNPIEFHYLGFGGSSIDFQVRFWVEATEKLTKLEVVSEAIMLVKQAFDDQGIDIPFPIRTLHVQKSVPLKIHNNNQKINSASAHDYAEQSL